MEKFGDWKVGQKRHDGVVSRIFQSRSDKFIIYELDNSGRVIFDSKEDIGLSFSNIQVDWIETLNLLHSKRLNERYIHKIAGVLSLCLQGKAEVAKERLLIIKKSIETRKTTVGRIEYLVGATIFAILLIGSILTITKFYLFDDSEYFIMCKVAIFGILGGILSVSVGLKSIRVEVENTMTLFYGVVGSTRVVVSAISSVAVYVLIKSQLVLGVIQESNDFVFYGIGLISGFSESYVPNLLRKVEK